MRSTKYPKFAMGKAVGFMSAWFISLLSAFVLQPMPLWAQQQFQGVCARVKIVIQQELTLERIGFEATLEVTNNDGEDPITDFLASLTFENPAFSTNGIKNDSSSLFFVQAPRYTSINSANGDGVISPTTKAVIKWFIIPKITAGGTSPEGVRYQVGCKLAGKLRGVSIPPEIMLAIPAPIYVKPEPQLEITYFQPRDVQGDDPFTPEVESPDPFTLGVLVKNSGFGLAKSVKIASQQPKIVENRQSLLLIAQLLGARVADQPVPSGLTVNIGDLAPGQTRKGAWDMITTLSGEFVEFKASYTHASELGGLETSVIKSMNAYFISHEVMNDQSGRDSLKDFLAITDNSPELVPNALYESQGNILPVNYLTNAAVTGSAGPGGSFTVTLAADKPGWAYLRLPDPGQAKIPIARVVRSDGKILNPNNYWTNVRYTRVGNYRNSFLNVFDLVDIRDYTYTVTYSQLAADSKPPVTTMRFAGSVTETGGAFYITPDTQIYFTAEDASPVSMFYSVTNSPFRPALPFSLSQPGTYFIRYYAVDSFGNRESTNFNNVIVSDSSGLEFANVSAPASPIFLTGDAVSVRPARAPIAFQAAANPGQVNASIDIFRGVAAWATLSGIPSSPTSDSAASIAVGGDFVDVYKYKLDNGPWTAELPVNSPIVLSGLAAGSHTISVLGRSSHGTYLEPSDAATASWVVSPSAPPTRITGTPPTPTRGRSALLSISGSGVTAYKWTINDGFFRPETNAPGVLPISISSSTGQVVKIGVLGKVSGTFQPTNTPTTVQWLFDPMFGYSQRGLPLVRSAQFTNIGAALQSFVWDGLDQNGKAVQPGYYTARLTLTDTLGRTNFASRLIHVGELAGQEIVIAEQDRGPRNPHARNSWAVWQDQASGNSEIYVRNIRTNGTVIRLTNTPLSQENPRTDGRYVVWQARQPNGNWDIYIKDLAQPTAPSAALSTLNADEVNPTIDWPWLAYQRRSAGATSAPWQLVCLNLLTRQSAPVWPSTQDQVNPDVREGRVVWQDWRDVGPGEIYFKNLESGEQFRITTNTFGQYHPTISGRWIIWQDNRNSQVDLYGFDLARNTEVRITSTAENESRPYLDSSWVTCLEDSLALAQNIKLIHLPSLLSLPVTRTSTQKERPALASGKAVWLDLTNNIGRVTAADIPALQPVFENRNTVVVTEAMAAYQQNAHSLLRLWNAQAGVSDITIYNSLTPLSTQTVSWVSGNPTGPNFALTPGKFLWIKFPGYNVVDLGSAADITPLGLPAGTSLLSYSRFPDAYSAYTLLQQLGPQNARAVRMLDSESGRWVVAQYSSGRLVGVDFTIPRVAVLMLDLVNPVNNFLPQ